MAEQTTPPPVSPEPPAPAAKTMARKVGDLIQVKPAGVVTRPDGTSHVVVKGGFYLDQVGTFVVDGTKVVVK